MKSGAIEKILAVMKVKEEKWRQDWSSVSGRRVDDEVR